MHISRSWGGPISYRCWFIEGSLEVKLPTICRDGKAEVGRVREEQIREGESQKQGNAGARKGRKVAIHGFFFYDLMLRRVEK